MGGSRVAELAEEEAQRAEAEPEDEDAQDGPGENADAQPPEPPPEVDAPPPIGPEQIAKAEKAIKDQKARLGKILGVDAVVHDCFVCAGIGFMPELPPVGSTFKVVEDGDSVVLVTESPDPEVPLKQAPDKAACPECDGLGNVLSGSRNPNARVVGCSKCMGNGWITVPRDAAPSGHPKLDPLPMNVTAPNGEGFVVNDAWGRAPGHPHWGVPPSMIDANGNRIEATA